MILNKSRDGDFIKILIFSINDMENFLVLVFIFLNMNFYISCQNRCSEFEQINVIYEICHSNSEDCKKDTQYLLLKKYLPEDSIKFSFIPNFTDSLDIALNNTIIYSSRTQVHSQKEIKISIPANEINRNEILEIKLILNDRKRFARIEIPGFYMKVTVVSYMNEPIYEKYGLNHKKEFFNVNIDNHITVNR